MPFRYANDTDGKRIAIEVHWKEGGHRCDIWGDAIEYGPAVSYCWEDTDGRFWASNDEYGTEVNFCPQCGRISTYAAIGGLLHADA